MEIQHDQVRRVPAEAALRDAPLRSQRLLVMGGIVLMPFVIAGYVGLTVLMLVPLVGLRRMFPRPSRVRFAAAV